jgi:hypothetical protein
MAKVPGSEKTLTLLVNCKTYPAVSKKYTETVCTGGVEPSGDFVRLYPVPFRLLRAEEKYDRWDVIRVRAYKDTKDTRKESWHLEQTIPIKILKHVSSEKQHWDWMKKTVHPSREYMDKNNITNGCVLIKPLELYWKKDNTEWTQEDWKIVTEGNLFVDKDKLPKPTERIPYEFRLKFKEVNTGLEGDGKVLAWSYYAGYRKFRSKCNSDGEALQMVHDNIASSIFNKDKTVFAIFGTHSLWGIWMISAIYHVDTAIIDKDRKKGADLFDE